MKRFPQRQRDRWRILSQERYRRRLAREAHRRQLAWLAAPTTKAKKKPKLGRWPHEMAPTIFGLEKAETRRHVLRFIARLRYAVNKHGRVVVEFSRTERMYPSGTLLFVAELERIRRDRGSNQCFRCTYPGDRVVEQVLQQVGILDILRCKARLPTSSFADNVRHWQFATGNQVEGAKFEPLTHGIEGKVAEPLLKEFYGGVSEAMTNCIQHAYEQDRGDGVANSPDLRRWWMFSQAKDGDLSVAFCDTGIGIPRSLGSEHHWSRRGLLAGVLHKLGLQGRNEAELIRAAIELHESRTGEPHRGRGLMEIFNVVRNTGKGHFAIHSNNGHYAYYGKSKKELLIDFADSVMGTIITWTVPLERPETQL